MTEFHLRHTSSLEDADYILAALDSSLPQLELIGSGQQWGLRPMSERPEQVEVVRNAVRDALLYREKGKGDYVEAFIAEAETKPGISSETKAIVRTSENSKSLVQTGAMVTTDVFNGYLRDMEELRSVVEEAERKKDFLFVRLLVGDYRAGPARKGAGAALVERVRRRAGELGKKSVYVDCWGGNGGRLVK
jgi:hypothetical protein